MDPRPWILPPWIYRHGSTAMDSTAMDPANLDLVLDEPPMFEVTIHNGPDSRIDQDRGATTSVIQKASVKNFGYHVNYAAKVRLLITGYNPPK